MSKGGNWTWEYTSSSRQRNMAWFSGFLQCSTGFAEGSCRPMLILEIQLTKQVILVIDFNQFPKHVNILIWHQLASHNSLERWNKYDTLRNQPLNHSSVQASKLSLAQALHQIATLTTQDTAIATELYDVIDLGWLLSDFAFKGCWIAGPMVDDTVRLIFESGKSWCFNTNWLKSSMIGTDQSDQSSFNHFVWTKKYDES